MHKIKKYQSPFGALNFGTTLQTLFDTYTNNLEDFTAATKDPTQNWRTNPSVLGKDPSLDNNWFTGVNPDSRQNIAAQNKSLFGGKSKVGGTTPPPKPSGLETFLGKKGVSEGLNALPGLIDSGLNLAGVKPATIRTGFDDGLAQGADAAWKLGISTGNPLAVAAGAGLQGLKYLNELGGKNTTKLGTRGLQTGPYLAQDSLGEGQRTTLFTRKRAKGIDQTTRRADRHNLLAGSVAFNQNLNSTLANNSYSFLSDKNKNNLFGGINTSIISAKKGTTINPKQFATIKRKAIKSLKVGGTISEEVVKKTTNVIPEGALHARKNNYEGELAEQVTHKGIPVITYGEGNKISQHAEIEHSEIIFNKEVSDKLEKMYKEHKEAEGSEKRDLELECGKFVASEIMENTTDNVGLLNTE